MTKRRSFGDNAVFTGVSVSQLRDKFEMPIPINGSYPISTKRKSYQKNQKTIQKSSSFRVNGSAPQKTELIIEELFHTEKIYVATLIKIKEDYLPFLKIDNQKVTEIFEILQNLSDMQILFGKKLEPLRLSPDKIAECFVRSQCLFQIYEEFISNQSILMKILSNSKNKKKIDKRAEELDDKLGLLAHILTPFQRLPRYNLLLREMLKECRNETSQKKIETAVEYIENLICDINSKVASNNT